MELRSILQKGVTTFPGLRLADGWQLPYRPILQFRALESLIVRT